MIDLEAVREGVPGARDSWTEGWWPRVYRMALALTGHEADAEDLAQEVLLAALAGVGRFRGEASEATWLYAILLRKAKGRKPHATPPPAEPRDSDLEGALALLTRLPPPQRLAAALFYVEDMTIEEISRALCVPKVTIRWRLFRARQRLRRNLATEEP